MRKALSSTLFLSCFAVAQAQAFVPDHPTWLMYSDGTVQDILSGEIIEKHAYFYALPLKKGMVGIALTPMKDRDGVKADSQISTTERNAYIKGTWEGRSFSFWPDYQPLSITARGSTFCYSYKVGAEGDYFSDCYTLNLGSPSPIETVIPGWVSDIDYSENIFSIILRKHKKDLYSDNIASLYLYNSKGSEYVPNGTKGPLPINLNRHDLCLDFWQSTGIPVEWTAHSARFSPDGSLMVGYYCSAMKYTNAVFTIWHNETSGFLPEDRKDQVIFPTPFLKDVSGPRTRIGIWTDDNWRKSRWMDQPVELTDVQYGVVSPDKKYVVLNGNVCDNTKTQNRCRKAWVT